MRPTQNLLIAGMLGVVLLGAWWIARAQDDRSPWGRPVIMPPDETPRTPTSSKPMDQKKGKVVSYPRTAQPLTAKPTDKPRAVAPRDLYDVPRAVSAVSFEENEPVRQTGGQAPLMTTEPLPLPKPPALPALPNPKAVDLPMLEPKGSTVPPQQPIAPVTPPPSFPTLDDTAAPIAPPLLPMLDTKAPLMNAPMVADPTAEPPKSGVTEPISKPTASVPPPLPVPVIKPTPPTAVAPAPFTTPEAKSTPSVAAPTPFDATEPKSTPPTIVAPAPLTVPGPRPAIDGPKAFERIRPARNQPAVVQPTPTPNTYPIPVKEPIPTAGPSATPPAGMLVQLQTPAIIVEKRGTPTPRAGETVHYSLVVRNLSSAPAHLVRIVDELPSDATLVAADPSPELQGGKATWLLPNVPAQGELTLRLALRLTSAAEFAHHTSVLVSAANSAKPADAPGFSGRAPAEKAATVALRPHQDDALFVRLLSPANVAMGKPFVFDVQITNQSSQPCVGLDLFGSLPEGLTGWDPRPSAPPLGQKIKGAFEGTLQPGESKTLRMPVLPMKPGRYTVEARIVTRAGHEASATAAITIDSDNLQLQQALNTKLYVGRDADHRIEVTNHTGQPMRNVTIVNTLPEGLEFVAASDHGLYQANRRGVHWVIDHLPPGRSHVVTMRLHGMKPGQYQHAVTAKADGSPEVRSVSVIPVEGVPGLSMQVIDRDNPLEIGRETVYEIEVANPGTTPSTNVKVQVQFPPGLTPRNAQGHGNTRYTADRQTVVFDPLPTLGPQGQAIYRVSAVANQVGDQRVRFAVVSDQTPTPIVREQGTKVYRD